MGCDGFADQTSGNARFTQIACLDGSVRSKLPHVFGDCFKKRYLAAVDAATSVQDKTLSRGSNAPRRGRANAARSAGYQGDPLSHGC